MACAVPDAGGLLFRRFRGAWYNLDVPRHLFHFTPATLTAMLAKAGWKVERVRPEMTLNGLAGTLGYFLRDRSGGTSTMGEALLRVPEVRSPLKMLTWPLELLLTAFRQTGRMVVWARARPRRSGGGSSPAPPQAARSHTGNCEFFRREAERGQRRDVDKFKPAAITATTRAAPDASVACTNHSANAVTTPAAIG